MNILKYKDLRNKILLVLILFAIYKVGTYVPTPGVNRDLLKAIIENNNALGFANIFSGGALQNFSIFALGVMPYITASIILQLLAMDIVPTLTEWRKQGADGEKKMKRLTYKLAVLFALVQSIGVSLGFNKMMPGVVIETNVWNYMLIAGCLTLGTIVLMVFGEIIEKRGIGKGISMIILAGILMSIPTAIYQYATIAKGNGYDFMFFLEAGILLIGVGLLLLIVIQVNRAERRIAIHYAKNGINGNGAKNSNYIPIKVTAAGVIPVIFASTLFMAPVTVAQLFSEYAASQWVLQHINYQSTVGMIVYALLIGAFTYFYAFIAVNPEKLAENVSQSGGYILGVRPGQATAERIHFVLKHITFMGAVFLAIISVLPLIVGKAVVLPTTLTVGGTSLIILVSVIVDVKSQLRFNATKKQYTGFIKK